MVGYAKIEEEIDNMKSGEKKFFSDDINQFQGVYQFLLALEKQGAIDVKEHRESRTGHRLVDGAFVTKL